MNAETKITREADCAGDYASLVRSGFDRFSQVVGQLVDIEMALHKLERIGDATTTRSAARLRAKLHDAEPSVTMIGQVKAGKTSLINAMVGWPELLPADINPWTSVVTSLHLNPRRFDQAQKARFQFFDSNEWDRLILSGGRVGELAGRAGADSEIEKVRHQIADMQEKSRRRLGRKFELLLGQAHEYGHVNRRLVERYVCLGDDFEENTDTSKTQGRFADITKSADLYLHRPELPMALCIRDTPGVNDTFMVREQITIRAIRDSRICVVVLSAHQALSSVDMALIRLITNVKAREVVIFVNRIDELSNPARQVPEIRDSIRATLRDHQGPAEAQIIFGSAYWANQALVGSRDSVPGDSEAAMENWASATACDEDLDRAQLSWKLSGIPELFDAIGERIAEGVGRELVDAAARDARNLAGGVRVSSNIVTLRKRGGSVPEIDAKKLSDDLDRLAAESGHLMGLEFDRLMSDFVSRLDRSHQTFLQRATAALIDHLEKYGDSSAWRYNPTGLRVLFRSSYQLYAKRANDATGRILTATANDLTKLYRDLGLIDETDVAVEPPAVPPVPPPVLLGQTIALDLQTNWWSRWWRKQRGYRAYADEFRKLIQAETEPIVGGLKSDHALTVRANATRTLKVFVKEQSKMLLNLAEQSKLSEAELAKVQGSKQPNERQAVLTEVLDTLGQIAA